MFDGNHRTRRNINLSGNSRRRNQRSTNQPRNSTDNIRNINAPTYNVTNTKADILEHARLQRQQRMQRQKEMDSAKILQRLFRGFRARLNLMLLLDGYDYNSDIAGKDSLTCLRVVSRRLSPPLISLLVVAKQRNKRTTDDDGGHDKTMSKEKCTQEMLLSLQNVVFLSQKQQQQQYMNSQNESLSKTQQTIIKTRILFHSILLLHAFFMDPSQTNYGNIDRLLNLMDYLLQFDNDDDLEFFQSVWNMGDGIITKQTGIAQLSLKSPVTNKKAEGKGGEQFMKALVSCFKNWFWASLNGNNEHQQKQFDEKKKNIASKLLQWTFRASIGSLFRLNHGMDDCLCVLATVTLCARDLKEVELHYGKQLQDCFHTLEALQEQQRPHGLHSSVGNSLKYWYGRQIQSVAKILITTASMTEESKPSDRRIYVLSQIVRNIMSGGKNIPFMFNVCQVFDNYFQGEFYDNNQKTIDGMKYNGHNSAQDDNLCISIVVLLNAALIPSRNNDMNLLEDDAQILSVLCGLVAKGEDVKLLLSSLPHWNESDVVDDLGKMEGEEGDHMSDVEMDDYDNTNIDHHQRHSYEVIVPSSAGHESLATSRPQRLSIESSSWSKRRAVARRQDLQTISKLDQLYQSEIMKSRKEVLILLQRRINSRKMVEADIGYLSHIAKDIGGGELMLKLGLVIFRTEIASDVGDARQITREAFVRVLSNVLQSCTSTKSKVGGLSPLLSKLVFNRDLLQGLWLHTQHQLSIVSCFRMSGDTRKDNAVKSLQIIKAYTSMTVFCDLFSEHLLAMDDEEFLSSYTNQNVMKGSTSVIRAEDLIIVIRDILYQLYWDRPVVASDIMAPSRCLSAFQVMDPTAIESAEEQCQSGRLLLSGTKLWNALYERWSRLLQSRKFCDEQCWLFPRLLTRERDEEGVFANGRESVDDEDDGDDVNDNQMDLENDNMDGGPTASIQVTTMDEENDALASSFRDPKMARILTSIPQALPFDRRVKLFQSLRKADILRTQDESAELRQRLMNMQRGDDTEFTGRARVEIRRDRMYEDAMDQLNNLGRGLRKKVQVSFINQYGAAEAGIDGGGVFKEFLDDLIKDAFNPEAGSVSSFHPLFTVSPVQALRVNSSLRITSIVLSHYEFLGRVLGKAVYEAMLVEPQFCLPFLNQLLGKHNTLDDLKNLDPEYYRQLCAVRRMKAKDINGMGLSFELTIRRSDGENETVELIPNGSSIPVTEKNVIHYAHLVAYRRLNKETAAQTHAFLRGFRDLIPAAWVRLFSPYELQKLIGGDDSVKGFDVKGLKSVMQYSGGYHDSQPIIQWFWEVVEEMSPEQQRRLLKFVTSCSRQPLLGFQALSPQPCIQQLRLPEEEFVVNEENGNVRLPSSATCMHLLKLPNYRTKKMLKNKLLYAIESGAGFELS